MPAGSLAVETALSTARVGAFGLPAILGHSPHVEASLEALSANTRRAYGIALRSWGLWASVHGVDAIAAPPARLRGYLLHRAEAGASLSSLKLTVTSIRKMQALAGVRVSAGDDIIRDTIAGIRKRSDAASPRQAPALTNPALVAITTTACQPRIGKGGFPEAPARARKRGLVDIALCRLMSDAGLRRSEAAALVWDDLDEWEDGSGRLTIRRSKTSAESQTVYVTAAAVDALGTMRPIAAAGADSIFGITAATIARRVKAAAHAAGLGSRFSGHSGRVGMARRMASAGAPTHEIQAQGRWKGSEMVAAYTRAEEAGRAARWLG